MSTTSTPYFIAGWNVDRKTIAHILYECFDFVALKSQLSMTWGVSNSGEDGRTLEATSRTHSPDSQ